MLLQTKEQSGRAKKITLSNRGKEIGRVWIYFIHNDLHQRPYALIEDLFVQKTHRSKGFGRTLVQAAVAAAKKERCYKVLSTSRYERQQVHQFYQKLGFRDYGKEFRLDID